MGCHGIPVTSLVSTPRENERALYPGQLAQFVFTVIISFVSSYCSLNPWITYCNVLNKYTRKLYVKVHYIPAYRGIILISYNGLKYLILPSTNIHTYLKTCMHAGLMYCIHGNSHKPLVLLGVNLVVLLNELSGARLPARDLQGTHNCKTPSWNQYLSFSVHTHTGVHWWGAQRHSPRPKPLGKFITSCLC